jgi:hypothetical protein
MLAGRLASRELLLGEQDDLWSSNTEEVDHEQKMDPEHKPPHAQPTDFANSGVRT